MIDSGTSHGATIERELFEETILKIFDHTKNRHYIDERLEYYKNIDNCFIPLFPLCSFDSREGLALREVTTINNKPVGIVVLAESYDNAKKYVDAHCVKLVDEAPPIGILDKNTLKDVLREYGVEYVKLDAETIGECIVPVEKMYNNIFDEPHKAKTKEDEPILIPMANQTFEAPLNDGVIAELNEMTDIQIIKKLPTMNLHMLLKTAEIYVDKIVKEKKEGKDTTYIENVYKLVLYL
jgi:hypothetical protein